MRAAQPLGVFKTLTTKAKLTLEWTKSIFRFSSDIRKSKRGEGGSRGERQIFALAEHVPLLTLNIYKETKKDNFPEMSVLMLLLF